MHVAKRVTVAVAVAVAVGVATTAVYMRADDGATGGPTERHSLHYNTLTGGPTERRRTDGTDRRHGQTARTDGTDRRSPRTAPEDGTRGRHPRTAPEDCTRGLHPRTAPEDCTRGLHPRPAPEAARVLCATSPAASTRAIPPAAATCTPAALRAHPGGAVGFVSKWKGHWSIDGCAINPSFLIASEGAERALVARQVSDTPIDTQTV